MPANDERREPRAKARWDKPELARLDTGRAEYGSGTVPDGFGAVS